MNRIHILKATILGLLLGLNPGIHAAGFSSYIAQMNPKVLTQKISDSTLGSFIKRNKIAMGAVALGSTAAYLAYVGLIKKDWSTVIAKAKTVTNSLNDVSARKANKLINWGMKKWPTASDLAAKRKDAYAALRDEKYNDKDEQSFIKRMLNEIDKEKESEDYLIIKGTLENCLAECRIVPRMELSSPIEIENNVTHIIDGQKDAWRAKDKTLYELSAQEIGIINKQVLYDSTVSVLNPYRLIRYCVLPYESEASRQYWKILQLLARLEALEYCLNERAKEIVYGQANLRA